MHHSRRRLNTYVTAHCTTLCHSLLAALVEGNKPLSLESVFSVQLVGDLDSDLALSVTAPISLCFAPSVLHSETCSV